LLGGLGFSVSGVQWGQLVDCPFGFAPGNEVPGQLSYEPPARYASPEMCSMPCKCGLESDIFALGLLTYELMSTERQPLLRGAPRGYTNNMVRQASVPPDLYPALMKILSPSPNERMTISAFLNSEFFMDRNVRAIRFLEQLNEKDETQRVTFLKGLPQLLADPQSPLCSQRVLRERVLPRLCSALLFPSLYGVVVPIIIGLLKRDKVTDCAHFQAKLWPSIKPLYTAKEIPIEVVTLFLKELDLQCNLATPADQQAVLLPFLLRCLELQEPVILNEVLEKVPFLHKKFEYRQVKDQILPRMLQLLTSSAVVKVKVQVLMGLTRIFEIFDKATITDVILPAFDKLTKMDRTPAVCMCLLGCYDAMSKFLGPKVTAERILPLICPLLVEESLSAEQYESQMTVCRKLLQRVEVARQKEYATKKEMQAEAGHALGGGDVLSGGTPPTAATPKQAEPQDFESLLFAGTSKARPSMPTAPAVAPLKAPPPPTPATGAGAGSDFFGFSVGGSAPSTSGLGSGGFDPFASSMSAPAAMSQPGAFDPFSGMAGGAGAPAFSMSAPCGGGGLGGDLGGLSGFGGPSQPAAGGFGGHNGFGGPPNPMAAFGGPGGGGFGMPEASPSPGGMPGMPGMPGMQGAAGMRNMAYDPFAEIDTNRGGAPGSAPAGGMSGGMGYPPMS